MGMPSGLDYTAVQYPIRLWHGEADATVPAHHAEYVAALLPNAKLDLLAGIGHLHTTDRWAEFFDTARQALDA